MANEAGLERSCVWYRPGLCHCRIRIGYIRAHGRARYREFCYRLVPGLNFASQNRHHACFLRALVVRGGGTWSRSQPKVLCESAR
jgi:hypothetical protein